MDKLTHKHTHMNIMDGVKNLYMGSLVHHVVTTWLKWWMAFQRQGRQSRVVVVRCEPAFEKWLVDSADSCVLEELVAPCRIVVVRVQPNDLLWCVVHFQEGSKTLFENLTGPIDIEQPTLEPTGAFSSHQHWIQDTSPSINLPRLHLFAAFLLAWLRCNSFTLDRPSQLGWLGPPLLTIILLSCLC